MFSGRNTPSASMPSSASVNPSSSVSKIRLPQGWLIIYAGFAAFFTYFSMYAFRKPFVVGQYHDLPGWVSDLDFKATLIIAQVCGYALSKFIGIKVVSEMQASRRALVLFSLVMLAQASLILFAILPVSVKWMALFLNGLPLGMIWGIVFSFLEGRRITEALAAILAASLIVSSGAVKSVGAWLLVAWNVPELWMPAATGAIFILPLGLSVIMLSKVPPPTREDQEQRQIRGVMNKSQRWQYFHEFRFGLICLIITYVLLTIMRDFSDNFAAEIWQAIGYGTTPEVFTTSLLPATVVVLLSLALMMLIKSNKRALQLIHLLVISGCLLCIAAVFLYLLGFINGLIWMTFLNMGLYMAYIPFNAILFDRLIAASHRYATAGFLIYIADSFGYLGSTAILIYKQFAFSQIPWLDFVLFGSLIAASTCVVFMLMSAGYFYQRFSGLSPRSKNKNIITAQPAAWS